MINFEDFKKLELKIGTVESATKIENSEKLLKLIINFGEEKRQIVAGLAKTHKPEELINKQIPVILNLEPRKLMNIESQGMILAADNNNQPVLLNPETNVPNGSIIR